jgi:CRP-like cAMP-binding protein
MPPRASETALAGTQPNSFFLTKARREMDFLTQSAEERYLNLFTEQTRLIQQIPGRYLASYIGITPQALSRIRKRIY